MDIDRFMAALSGQESGGSYTAENGRTGAYGRFQILPSNWPSWSREAGIAGASPTPENQELVARYKIQQYYDKFGNWRDVASTWYSGSPESSYSSSALNRKQGAGNEPSIKEYVDSVMSRAGVTKAKVSNARANTAAGVVMKTPTKPDEEKKGSFPVTDIIRAGVAIGKSKAKGGKGRFVPSGDYNTDAAGYFNQAQAAYDELAEYQSSNNVIIDEESGTVLKLTGETDLETGQPVAEVDPIGTRILTRAMNASASLDRLYTAKKNGLFNAGNEAAQAYLTSEKEKAAEADRKYGNYTKRISDVVALEDLPVARMQNMASMLNTVNSVNEKRQGRFDSKLFAGSMPVKTDMQPFANAIKQTIPGQAPEEYNMNPAAMAPPQENQLQQEAPAGSVPMPLPEEALSLFNRGEEPPPIPNATPGMSQPPQTLPWKKGMESRLTPLNNFSGRFSR